LERDKIKRAADFIGAHSIDVTALEWEFVANLAPMFKTHLRPLLRHLPLAGQRQDADLLEAIDFLKACFEEGRSLVRCRFEQIPKAFIPQSAKPYLYEKDADGHRRIHPDRYEFLVYRMLRNRLEAGDIYVSDSLRFRSFDEDLIPRPQWQQHKERILRDADVPALAQPMAQMLQELETEQGPYRPTLSKHSCKVATLPSEIFSSCASVPNGVRPPFMLSNLKAVGKRAFPIAAHQIIQSARQIILIAEDKYIHFGGRQGVARRCADQFWSSILNTLGLNRRMIKRYLEDTDLPKLHIGCGEQILPGWLNTDLYPDFGKALFLDVTKKFPLGNATFRYAFSSHLIEHIPYPAAASMLAEIYRVLTPGGRLRIVTPSWEFLQSLLNNEANDARVRDYIEWATKQFAPWAPQPGAVFVVNNFVRNWGHTFIYDKQTLQNLVMCTGFKAVRECKLNESEIPELRNLENEVRLPPGFLRLESMSFEGLK